MIPTKESHKLMSFFVKNNCILPINQTNKTNQLFKKLYMDMKNGVSYINSQKEKFGNAFYKLKITHIINIKQIPKPSTFPPNSFPDEVRNHIDEFSLSVLTYTFHLFGRQIKINFIIEDMYPELLINTYNDYVDYMLVWLYILNEYASRTCSTSLVIYIYHTSLLKNLPQNNIEVLGEINVNTAFTRTCPKNAEIIVFRKEEWFKVFIHETLHNFGLDFSDMDNTFCKQKILDIFPVNSDVNLFEAYTEFWARIINSLFCSFNIMKREDNENDVEVFLKHAEYFINFERIYAFFQMIKILNFMDISYKELYEESIKAVNIRKTLYKENTNVLSYYIITLILLNNYQDFLAWCNKYNTSLIQFKKTTANLEEFCKFIEKKYKNKNILDGISCTEELLQKSNKKYKKNPKQNDLSYILKNLRMTICELG